MAHYNYAAQAEKAGVEVTLLHSGAHKVDGNPYEKLPDKVRSKIQAAIDATRLMFAEKVAQYTGLSVEAVLATEAAVYSGAEALDVGLADELVLNTDAIAHMRDAIGSKTTTRNSGGAMSNTTTTTTAEHQPGGENLNTEQQGTAATLTAEQLQAAVKAENQRMMGIMNCEEACGRSELAKELAATEGLSVEDARRIMAAAPASAQVRSQTALDALMDQSPDALASAQANAAGDSDNDLLDIPC